MLSTVLNYGQVIEDIAAEVEMEGDAQELAVALIRLRSVVSTLQIITRDVENALCLLDWETKRGKPDENGKWMPLDGFTLERSKGGTWRMETGKVARALTRELYPDADERTEDVVLAVLNHLGQVDTSWSVTKLRATLGLEKVPVPGVRMVDLDDPLEDFGEREEGRYSIRVHA